jgi:hypothetical protein
MSGYYLRPSDFHLSEYVRVDMGDDLKSSYMNPIPLMRGVKKSVPPRISKNANAESETKAK